MVCMDRSAVLPCSCGEERKTYDQQKTTPFRACGSERRFVYTCIATIFRIRKSNDHSAEAEPSAIAASKTSSAGVAGFAVAILPPAMPANIDLRSIPVDVFTPSIT